ncbi:hypothetical protein NLJ89_g9152 [Agrocybe chaxingu]|uniref:Uncharacterized protein n=1 Tax=Agrocybe chaxingu TaxID=84603 RepID=A0A9W8JT99_9AGAR|nr:hypothetical protein NLJ89_g9152 [Agrocybe chaxingu]
MPPPLNRPPKNTRAKDTVCKCKSHCTLYNPQTGTYEGDGHIVSRRTRDNHVADDKKRAAGSIHLLTTQTVLQREDQSNWIKIINDELNILLELPITSPMKSLVFCNSPSDHGPFAWPSDQEIMLFNHGLYALTGHCSNRALLSTEQRFVELYTLLQTFDFGDQTEEGGRLLDRLLESIKWVIHQKEIQWAIQRGQEGDVIYVNSEMFVQEARTYPSSRRAACLLTLIMENIFFTSRRALRVHLAGLRGLLRATGASQDAIDSIPMDPRSAGRGFNLDPVTRTFICCPSCHCLYPYNPGDSPEDEDSPSISHCLHTRTPGSPMCNTPLWKRRRVTGGQERLVPVWKYVHQDLKSWLGRLLLRKGMEDILDKPLNAEAANEATDDIWGSPAFADLKDATGEPFLSRKGKEGRLVFSLSVDSFNLFYNKTAKQTVSSTGIWMVLLNLPQHLRYLHENMYVAGVIPGPDKPSKEDIYSYLELLVKELQEFWQPRVFFSRTYREVLGRLFLALLIPVICDMLAARQVLGLSAPTSHHFCTFCDLDIDDIDVVDRHEWPMKDLGHVRHYATLWRDAPTEKVQEMIFDACGVKWTPLLDLPYWNPILYAVVNSMHALDLNLLQNHCRNLFQINPDKSGNVDAPIAPVATTDKRITTKQHLNALKKCLKAIADKTGTILLNELLLFPRRVLYTICVDNDIVGANHTSVVGIKWVLANNIVLWKQNFPARRLRAYPLPGIGPDDDDMDDLDELASAPNTLPLKPGVDIVLAARVIRHVIDMDDRATSRSKAYSQGSAATFSYILDLLGLDHGAIEKTQRQSKRLLFDLLTSSIDDDFELFEELQSYVQDSVPNTNRAILDRELMRLVWDDMTRTQLPTWITPAPRNWGTMQHGKLSADNWRIFRLPAADNTPNTYLVVQELVPAAPEVQDPYPEYGIFGGFLCKAVPGEWHVIHITQVISHFAMTRFMDGPFKDLIHVSPVDRLMYEFSLEGA